MKVRQLIVITLTLCCTGCYTIAFYGPKPKYFRLNYEPSSGVNITWVTKSNKDIFLFSLKREVYRIGDPLSARPLEFRREIESFRVGDKVSKGEPFYFTDKNVEPGKRYCYMLGPVAPGMLNLSGSRFYCIDIKSPPSPE